MGYKSISAYTASVLSILLIFNMFSFVASDFSFDFNADFVSIEEKQEQSCAMNAPESSLPFSNTRIASAPGVDISEENRLFNISVLSDLKGGNAINVSETLKRSPDSDKRERLSVRLLI